MDKTLDLIIKEIANAPIRSSIITATAVIESTLEKLISNCFIKDAESLRLFDGNGCLSTFSAKINIAYSMGLISKELFKDLDSYRNIRNRCAHELCMNDSIENSIRDRAKNFYLLNNIVKMGDSENLKSYTTLEFAAIFIALIKRLNNVEKFEEYPFEAHDNYLGFDDRDYEIISEFSKYIK